MDPSHFPQVEETTIPYLLAYLLYIPQELNAYSYVRNNPANLVDQFGLGGGQLDDCGIMEKQEKATRTRLFRGRKCLVALETCERNCQNAWADSCIEGEDFDTDKCIKECDDSLKQCQKGKGFKHPQMLYDKFNCTYKR